MRTEPKNPTERVVALRSTPLLGKIVYHALWLLLGIDLPSGAVLGQDVRLNHGARGFVCHCDVVIGDNVQIFHGVTLGRSDSHLPASVRPSGGGIIVGDRVVLGAGAVVLFRSGETIAIGDDAVIGANAVITQCVPPKEIWAGNPARKVGVNPAYKREAW